tara:strand:+ start:757 stop:957 length:201 start_codon:yes stop_codon:yes gene_type:complete
MQVKCKADCGFVADSGYFVRKKRFMPGLCPRCNGAIKIVEAFTNNVVEGAAVDTNPQSITAGEVTV